MTATVFMGAPRDDERRWQFSGDVWPSCHSWRILVKRSFSAMFIVILLAALSLFAVVVTATVLPRDGYRRVPTDWTKLP